MAVAEMPQTDERVRPFEEWGYRPEVVPIKNLMVDKEYQRETKNAEKRIVDNFKPHLIGALCVSERKGYNRGGVRHVTEGAIFDGQTRWEALKILKVPDVLCLVYEDLTPQEEAALFADIQEFRRNATSYEKFRARLVAGDLEAAALDELVKVTGYVIGETPRGRTVTNNVLPSVAALRWAFHKDEFALERGLMIFRAAWGEKEKPSAWHIRGMVQYLIEYPDIEDDRLSRRLGIAGADYIHRQAMMAKKVGASGAGGVPYMVDAIKGVYLAREDNLRKRVS